MHASYDVCARACRSCARVSKSHRNCNLGDLRLQQLHPPVRCRLKAVAAALCHRGQHLGDVGASETIDLGLEALEAGDTVLFRRDLSAESKSPILFNIIAYFIVVVVATVLLLLSSPIPFSSSSSPTS